MTEVLRKKVHDAVSSKTVTEIRDLVNEAGCSLYQLLRWIEGQGSDFSHATLSKLCLLLGVGDIDENY